MMSSVRSPAPVNHKQCYETFSFPKWVKLEKSVKDETLTE